MWVYSMWYEVYNMGEILTIAEVHHANQSAKQGRKCMCSPSLCTPWTEKGAGNGNNKKTAREDLTKTEAKKTSPPTSKEEGAKKKSDSYLSSKKLKTPMKPLRKAIPLHSPVRLTRSVGKNSPMRNVKFRTLLDTWKLASSQNQAQTQPRLKEEMDSQTAD